MANVILCAFASVSGLCINCRGRCFDVQLCWEIWWKNMLFLISLDCMEHHSKVCFQKNKFASNFILPNLNIKANTLRTLNKMHCKLCIHMNTFKTSYEKAVVKLFDQTYLNSAGQSEGKDRSYPYIERELRNEST